MPIVTAIIVTAAAVIGTVGAIAGAVIATVGAILAPAIAAIAGVVGGVVSAIGGVLGGLVNVIGGIVEVMSAGLQAAVGALKTSIIEPLGNIISGLKAAIGEIAGAITEPLAPILNPIKDSLMAIKGFVAETQTWIAAELAPVAELIEVVNTVSAIMFVKQLIDGTLGVTEIIGEVADGSTIATAQAIVELSQNIVDISIGTLNYVHESNVALANAIDNYDEKIREDNRIALAMLSDSIDKQVMQVANSLTEQLLPIESDVTMVTRRTEDLPYFQDMLIRALG